jgi:hypothetical protein
VDAEDGKIIFVDPAFSKVVDQDLSRR